MTIRIGSNTTSLLVQRNLADASSRLSKTFEQLSSGQRINRAADDAAGLAIAGGLQVKSRIFGQGLRNLSDSLSVTSVAKEALTTLSGITIRQRELAEQAANGVYSFQQRQALNNEAKSLTDEYNRIVGTTEFNGRKLLTQNWQSLVIQAGTGTDGTIGFKIGDDLAAKLAPGCYFELNGDGKKTCVYFVVDGEGTAPSVQADRFIGVNIKTEGKLEISDLTMPALPADPLDYDWDNAGYCLGIINDTRYYLWFDRGAGQQFFDFDPEDVGVRVDVTNLTAGHDLATAVEEAINGAGVPFSAVNLGGGNLRLSTLEPENIGDAWDDGAGITTTIVQQGQSAVCTASEVAAAVAQALSDQGIAAVTDGGSNVRITGSTTGNYINAQNENSNLFVSSIQNGTGLATYSMGSRIDGATLSDLNGDGFKDMVTAEYAGIDTNYNGTVSIRFGAGDGTFGQSTSYYTNGRTSCVRAADVNGDGKTDLIAGNYLAPTSGTGSVCVLLNQENGSFSAQPIVTIGKINDLAVADFDKDGAVEIAAVTYTSDGSKALTILDNNGQGSFNITHQYTSSSIAKGYGGIVAGDLDGDGVLDLATSSSDYGTELAIWHGDGTGNFSVAHTYATSTSGGLCAAGDIDGDGDLDFAYTDSGKATIRFNDGHGDFSDSRVLADLPSSRAVTMADLNGDGRPDLATASGSQAYVKLNTGGGNFASAVSYTVGAGAFAFVSDDLNSDGSSDMTVITGYGSFNGSFWVRLNNGNCTFYDPRGDQKEVTWLSFGDARGRCDVENIDLSTKGGALAALGTLETRLNKINNELGSLGANESRLHTASQALAAARDNYIGASSRITDADIAQTSAEQVRQQILLEVGSAILSQANQAPQIALRLLGGGT